MTSDQCYGAVLSRDRRFDGVFFVGVSSTNIYCRTVCTVRTPQQKNCTFYPSAAAAERAGYRPCLRCRPELAPGQAKIDAVGRLAAAAASRIEGGALVEQSVSELACSLGVSDRHLRRILQQEFGVSPIQLAQTQRLLLAKRLLSDSHLSVADIAFASGFSSVRRFNALFQKRYRLNPSTLRRTTPLLQDSLYCELAYRPPLQWQALPIAAGDLHLDPYSPVEATVARLKSFPGIGDWTAQYIAMRVLAYPDAFPHADLWLRRALAVDKPAQVLQLSEVWRPWRAYAAMYLWKSLETVE